MNIQHKEESLRQNLFSINVVIISLREELSAIRIIATIMLYLNSISRDKKI